VRTVAVTLHSLVVVLWFIEYIQVRVIHDGSVDDPEVHVDNE